MFCFRCFNSAALFVLLVPTVISGQEEFRPTLVSTMITSSQSHREKKLEDVIRASILMQLHLDGFESGNLGTSDYIVKVSYELIETNISISFEARQTKTDGKNLIATAKWEGPLSLNLDTEVQKVVHTVITPQMKKTIRVEETRSDNKWNLDLNLSRFVPVFKSNRVAKSGFGGYASFGYVVFLKQFSLIPGFKVGLIWIPTTPICSDNSTCFNSIAMIPLAAEIKLSYILNQKFHPYLTGGAGGVWLFKFVYRDKEMRGDMVPYADAALGIDIRFADVFDIFVEAELFNAFEEVGAIINGIAHITGIALNIGTGFRY